jgi:hypothetical protein
VKKLLLAGAFAAATGAASGALALDAFVLTFENAGIQSSTSGFDVVGVEDFNARALGTGSFVTDFGTAGAITATYSASTRIMRADKYGGALGTGRYPVAFKDSIYDLTLSYDSVRVPNGINYFGYWLSALDKFNIVEFYRGGTLVGSLDPAGVIARVGACPNASNAYCGNPNVPFKGQNSGEPYAFINFYDTNGTFDRVRFVEDTTGGAGYESDNHTVGYYNQITGNEVPEPASWALMIAGFGLVGGALRRRAAVACSAA